MSVMATTLMPFLYPCLFRSSCRSLNPRTVSQHGGTRRAFRSSTCRFTTTVGEDRPTYTPPMHDSDPSAIKTIDTRRSRLNPTADDYARNIFVDKCLLTVHAGSGGNGCVSFHRDAHISDGPPNGGDGGSGGNVWIQASSGHTSLHKLARRGTLKAGRGISGQGKAQGGRKGEDICIQVPVGTVVREVWRSDPVADEERRLSDLNAMDPEVAEVAQRESLGPRSNPWIMYPGAIGAEARAVESNLPKPPKPRRSHLSALQPLAPITLDLDKPMEKPILLAAGAMGGLGNPHFATKELPKPKYATKGELGVRLKFELELKLLADVGLVGLPNAGKSTLLRAISNSRTRIGDWAFTTLEPSIGTVVLDNNEGRPLVRSGIEGQPPRTNFTVADIPGLVEDAHLDRGLGLGFLRHVERARILTFVVDLSDADPVATLQSLWKEVSEYENLRNQELNEQSESRSVEWTGFGHQTTITASAPDTPVDEDGQEMITFPEPMRKLEPLKLPPISAKPWYVVATKADKLETQDAFLKLKTYATMIENRSLPHPSGQKNAWRDRIAVIPVSAINGEGVDTIATWTAGLLDSMQATSSSHAFFNPIGASIPKSFE